MDHLTPDLARPESLALLERLLQSADDAFFKVDLVAGEIVWSRGIQLLFGHDPSVVGRAVDAWGRLAHPDELEALVASGREVILGGGTVWSHEVRLARADGSYAPVRIRAFVVCEAGRPVWVVGSISDLSALRQLEEELREVAAELMGHHARRSALRS